MRIENGDRLHDKNIDPYHQLYQCGQELNFINPPQYFNLYIVFIS